MAYALGTCAVCGSPLARVSAWVCERCQRANGLWGVPYRAWPAWAKAMVIDWQRERRREKEDIAHACPMDERMSHAGSDEMWGGRLPTGWWG